MRRRTSRHGTTHGGGTPGGGRLLSSLAGECKHVRRGSKIMPIESESAQPLGVSCHTQFKSGST